jgi:hypothetical protein
METSGSKIGKKQELKENVNNKTAPSHFPISIFHFPSAKIKGHPFGQPFKLLTNAKQC